PDDELARRPGPTRAGAPPLHYPHMHVVLWCHEVRETVPTTTARRHPVNITRTTNPNGTYRYEIDGELQIAASRVFYTHVSTYSNGAVKFHRTESRSEERRVGKECRFSSSTTHQYELCYQ